MDTELFELCKDVYKRTGWDNNASTSYKDRLRVWQKGYSISEMGEGNDDYETTSPEERNKVNVYDWEVKDDPRHRITTGQEVFKWWYSEVKTIENNVYPLYTSDYLLEKLPKTLKHPATDEDWTLGVAIDIDSSKWCADYERTMLPHARSDTPLKALLKLTIALDEAKELPHAN